MELQGAVAKTRAFQSCSCSFCYGESQDCNLARCMVCLKRRKPGAHLRALPAPLASVCLVEILSTLTGLMFQVVVAFFVRYRLWGVALANVPSRSERQPGCASASYKCACSKTRPQVDNAITQSGGGTSGSNSSMGPAQGRSTNARHSQNHLFSPVPLLLAAFKWFQMVLSA